MKRILLTALVFLTIGIMAYAQQRASGNSASNQIKQNAQQYLNQAQSNNSEFQATLDDLKDRNGNNRDAYTFNRLKTQIERIEATINAEQKSISSSLDKGSKVNTEVMNRIENFINQHSEKIQELEEFIAN